MEEHLKVLITTSGLGHRLGDITRFTNKSLVRVGKKPALSYIIEAYPQDTDFVITLGHFGNQVKQFLQLAYPDHNFQFVTVDNYDGPGSSLCYSILQAKNYINSPFIFHACDTLVTESIPLSNKNWLGGCKTKNSANYVSFDTNGKFVNKLKEKGELNYDYSYIGLAGIYNYQEFFQALEEIYNQNPKNNQLSDVNALRQIIGLGLGFEYKEFKEWLDIGNVDGLKHAREVIPDKFEILDKLGESIFIFNDFVIKFFADEKICRNRVLRGKLLKGLVPEIIDSSDNFYKYKFSDGKLMANNATEDNFKDLLEWLKNYLWIEKSSDNFYDICLDFYFKKTKERINKFLTETGTEDITCQINGTLIPSINEMLNLIDWDWLCKEPPFQFHGDNILDNILILPNNEFCLLDWRQDFGGSLECGDLYYDLAKLNHNLVFNHDIVNRNLFTINISTKEIECDILRSHNLIQCQKILNKFLSENGFDIKKVQVLTALIWINMAPLHHYPLNQFLFYFGKLNLYKALNEIA